MTAKAWEQDIDENSIQAMTDFLTNMQPDVDRSELEAVVREDAEAQNMINSWFRSAGTTDDDDFDQVMAKLLAVLPKEL